MGTPETKDNFAEGFDNLDDAFIVLDNPVDENDFDEDDMDPIDDDDED